MKALWDEGGRRVLLGDNTESGAVGPGCLNLDLGWTAIHLTMYRPTPHCEYKMERSLSCETDTQLVSKNSPRLTKSKFRSSLTEQRLVEEERKLRAFSYGIAIKYATFVFVISVTMTLILIRNTTTFIMVQIYRRFGWAYCVLRNYSKLLWDYKASHHQKTLISYLKTGEIAPNRETKHCLQF